MRIISKGGFLFDKKMNAPIGIFDSGVGGTSIWREIQQLLPNEDTLYLADSANAPYGEKSKEEILGLSVKNTELLLEKGCKIVVVACNTATTNAIKYLRNNYGIPFIGIEPAIKPAALKTKTGKVGVLATQGTLSSYLFHHTAKLHASGITLVEQEGTGLVTLIESGKLHSTEIQTLLMDFLNPMLEENIDCLVLGCTHYPYLIPMLKTLLSANITIIDSGAAVARQTKTILQQQAKLAQNSDGLGTHQFYSNTNTAVLKDLLGNGEYAVDYLDF